MMRSSRMSAFSSLVTLLGSLVALSPAQADDASRKLVEGMKKDLLARMKLPPQWTDGVVPLAGPGQGEIGWSIYDEKPKARSTFVGRIGHPFNKDNAAGVEVRGTFVAKAGFADADSYHGMADWWRPAKGGQIDDTPIRMTIKGSISGRVKPDVIIGVMASSQNRAGRSYSIFDWIIGSDVMKSDPTYFKEIEASDVDFMSTNNFTARMPVVIGPAYNSWTLVVSGTSASIIKPTPVYTLYTINWTFN